MGSFCVLIDRIGEGRGVSHTMCVLVGGGHRNSSASARGCFEHSPVRVRIVYDEQGSTPVLVVRLLTRSTADLVQNGPGDSLQ